MASDIRGNYEGKAETGTGPAGNGGSAFDDFLFGLETEHLRLEPTGRLSTVPHPVSLRTPRFTRDFAENQLEIVTEPFADIGGLVERNRELTREAERVFHGDVFWPVSIPPRRIDEADVSVARFSGFPGVTEHDARKAEAYRRGLALRYGKLRQLICGVHLNVSFGERFHAAWKDAGNRGGHGDLYLRIVRYLYESLYLFILLSGASPVSGDDRGRKIVSVRNSPRGYAGTAYREYLDLSSLEAYASGLGRGLHTESSAWHGLGLVSGARVHQLNSRVFQTEKEFYAPIRFRAPSSDVMPGAVARGNIDRLELRFLDLRPDFYGGVSERMIRFLHLAILYGAFRGPDEFSRGRLAESLGKADAAAGLPTEDLSVRATETARSLLNEAAEEAGKLETFAVVLDGESGGGEYAEALADARNRLLNPELLPSVRLAAEFEASGSDWDDFILSKVRGMIPAGGLHELHAAG